MKFTAIGTLVAAVVVVLGLFFGRVALPLMAQSPNLPTTGVVTTEDDRLNLRDAPSTDSKIIGKIEPQSAVKVLATSDDGVWYQVEAAGLGTGWVSSQWVKLDNSSGEATLLPTPTPNPRQATPASTERGMGAMVAESQSSTGTVESPTAAENIAVASKTTAESIAQATPNVTTAGETPKSVNSGIFGRIAGEGKSTVTTEATLTAEVVSTEVVSTEVVSTVEPTPSPTPSATPTVPTAIIQPARMNIRGGPGTAFNIVEGVNQGTALEITGVTPGGDWYRVKLNDAGDTGWVFASLVQVAGPSDQIPSLKQEELPQAPVADIQTSAQVQVDAASPPIVSAPPPAGGVDFGYGVQAHMVGGEVGRPLDAVKDLGFNWIKQQFVWKSMGMGDAAAIIDAAGSRGVNVLLSVVDAPDSEREAGFDGSVNGPPANPGSYASFVGGMASQFCGSALKAIEVWNEENLNYEWGNKPLDPAEYMRLLAAAYASIKSACPSMYVISGALTPAGSNPPYAIDDFAYLEGMYQNGLAKYSDGVGAHPSGYNVPADVTFENACAAIQQSGNTFNGACDTPHHSWSFRSTMEGYRNIMNVYGDSNKKIWPTEFGWAAGGAFDPRYAYANDNSFDEQAQWTVEAYQMMKNWGWVGPAFLWNLNFRVVADGTEKAQWGIVSNDWSPLPVYTALKNMPK
jgi:uncharacterized protein YgiM (DUF1202 family)